MSFGNPFGVARPRHAAVVQLLPVACLIVGKLGYNAGALSSKTASERTLPASINPRASGIEHGTISTPPATRSCNPGAAPFDGTQGTAFGSIFRSLSNPANASCQMLPGARRFQLAGIRTYGVEHILDGLVRRVGTALKSRGVGVAQRERRVRSRPELGQSLPMQHGDFDGDHADRVTVRRRLRDRAMADDAVTARSIDDIDG